ncbi:MFS transporter [Sphingomonas sp.]|uniref:MFS transporter n=1 Tax=Sphingomonas sp. TaxID=28214 RepID=UPI003CC58E20
MANRKWIVAFVFVAIMLNYVDRQILALLKPTLEARFGWSDRDYANLATVFQIATAFAFLGTGWFIDRVGLRRGFGIGVAVWSLAAMAHAAAATVGAFFGARIVLGAAESIGTPAAVKTAATYFTGRARQVALGIGNTAPNVGAVVAPALIPPLAVAFGWQSAFLVAGGLGLIWVVLWFTLRAEAVAPLVAGAGPLRWREIAGRRETITIAAAKVLSDQVWFFMLSWLPDLFNRLFGLKQGQLGWPLVLVYAMAAGGALTGGWLAPALLARGWSPDRARKGALLLFALLVLPVASVQSLHGPWIAALVLGLGLFAHQGFSTNIFGLATDITPAASVGSTIGMAAFCGNLWSVGLIQFQAFALAAGWGYTPALAICAVSYLTAVGVIQLLIPRIVPVEDRGELLGAH